MKTTLTVEFGPITLEVLERIATVLTPTRQPSTPSLEGWRGSYAPRPTGVSGLDPHTAARLPANPQ